MSRYHYSHQDYKYLFCESKANAQLHFSEEIGLYGRLKQYRKI